MNKTKSNSIDWNDPNVLRTLPDGWNSVPADSGYAKEMRKYRWLKEDTRELAEKRYQDKQNEECKTRSKYECSHEHVSKSNSYRTCMICGLEERDLSQSVPEEGYEYRVIIRKIENDMCEKVRSIFEDLIFLLADPKITIEKSMDKLMDMYESYLISDDVLPNKKKYPFRISTGPEGLCAALLWREVLMSKIPLTMAGYSRKIAIRRETIMYAFAQLDDYKSLHIGKRGRPKKNKMLS